MKPLPVIISKQDRLLGNQMEDLERKMGRTSIDPEVKEMIKGAGYAMKKIISVSTAQINIRKVNEPDDLIN